MALLEVKNLKIHFPIRGGFFNTIQDYVRAVDDVSFTIEEGKTYGLIGESGSGKTTIGKAVVGLEKPTGGHILYGGNCVNTKAQRKKEKSFMFSSSIFTLILAYHHNTCYANLQKANTPSLFFLC